MKWYLFCFLVFLGANFMIRSSELHDHYYQANTLYSMYSDRHALLTLTIFHNVIQTPNKIIHSTTDVPISSKWNNDYTRASFLTLTYAEGINKLES